VVNNNVPVLHGYEDAKLQRFWRHDLDFFGGHVKSLVTWPLDSA